MACLNDLLMELMFADKTNLFLSYENIDTLFISMSVDLQMSQRG